MKLYMFRTVRLYIIRSLFTVRSAMVHVIQVCSQLLSRSICSCSTAVYNDIPLPSVQWINSWWWTEELTETCRVSWQNNFLEISASGWFYYKELGKMNLCIDNFEWQVLAAWCATALYYTFFKVCEVFAGWWSFYAGTCRHTSVTLGCVRRSCNCNGLYSVYNTVGWSLWKTECFWFVLCGLILWLYCHFPFRITWQTSVNDAIQCGAASPLFEDVCVLVTVFSVSPSTAALQNQLTT